MPHPFLFLRGYCKISVSASDAGRLSELCRRHGYAYRSPAFSGDSFTVLCINGVAKRLSCSAEAEDLALTVGEAVGLPTVLKGLRHRYTIPVGILFCVFLCLWSEHTLFSIRVEGNSRLADEEIIAQLEACGLSVGDSLRGIDTSVLENRVLIASEDLAWISVNLRGNVAYVVVREREAPPPEDGTVAANLVASRGGVIQWMEEIRGEIVVEVGDAVGKGDLLVSGMYGAEDGPLRLSRASGRVYARTDRSFEVRVPLVYEKKEYTGEVRTEKSLIFFKKEIKFYGNTGNLPPTCDTIDTVEHFGLSEDRILPVGIRTVEHAEYRTVRAVRAPDAAEELAYYHLRLQMDSELPEGMLVRKSLTWELTEEEYILRCDAEYLENIAEVKKIEVEAEKE
ncbi:MAG: sporulation protein YqfD [Clostridia bacterium]|nr:sporulation protein YqfD [Clostridia bacterium]